MLSPATPFPHVGSFALLIDETQPPEHQHAELVRILGFDSVGAGHPVTNREQFLQSSTAAIAFPLRLGAGGNRTVPASELIDGTPLNGAEQRELADAQRQRLGRERLSARLKALADRAAVLRHRAIWAPHLERLLRQHHAQRRSAAA